MVNLTRIDEALISKIGISDASYKENKDKIYNSAKEISSFISSSEDDFEVLSFVADYFELKKSFPKRAEVQACIDSVTVDNKKKFLPLMLSIRLRDLIASNEEFVKFFSLLANKSRFSAAELGDENNPTFIQVAVKVVNVSYAEEIESVGVKHGNNLSNVVTDEFKDSLWKRVDKKINMLKILKDDIYRDRFLVDDIDDTKLGAVVETSAKTVGRDIRTNIS